MALDQEVDQVNWIRLLMRMNQLQGILSLGQDLFEFIFWVSSSCLNIFEYIYS